MDRTGWPGRRRRPSGPRSAARRPLPSPASWGEVEAHLAQGDVELGSQRARAVGEHDGGSGRDVGVDADALKVSSPPGNSVEVAARLAVGHHGGTSSPCRLDHPHGTLHHTRAGLDRRSGLGRGRWSCCPGHPVGIGGEPADGHPSEALRSRSMGYGRPMTPVLAMSTRLARAQAAGDQSVTSRRRAAAGAVGDVGVLGDDHHGLGRSTPADSGPAERDARADEQTPGEHPGPRTAGSRRSPNLGRRPRGGRRGRCMRRNQQGRGIRLHPEIISGQDRVPSQQTSSGTT